MDGEITPEELKIILNSLVIGYANASSRLIMTGKLSDAQIKESGNLDWYYITEKRKILGITDESIFKKTFTE